LLPPTHLSPTRSHTRGTPRVSPFAPPGGRPVPEPGASRG
jgi:hypothetical protein